MQAARALVAGLLLSTPTLAHAGGDVRSIPAKWRFDLSSATLVGYKPNEYLILSSVVTGTSGVDAVQKYGLEVKVESWDKPYKASEKGSDGKPRDELVVTLHKLADPHEMQADFEETVWDHGKVMLHFAGTTILTRP